MASSAKSYRSRFGAFWDFRIYGRKFYNARVPSKEFGMNIRQFRYKLAICETNNSGDIWSNLPYGHLIDHTRASTFNGSMVYFY